MSGIKSKAPAKGESTSAEVVPAIKAEDILKSVTGVPVDVAERFAGILSDGVSGKVAEFVKTPTLADAAGMLAGAGWLAEQARKAGARSDRGYAVAVYALTSAKVMTGSEVAKALGRTPGRVSQLVTEGMVYSTLGLPEGWNDAGKITSAEIGQLASKASGEVRKVLTGKASDKTKRATLARSARKVSQDRQAAAQQAQADAQAAKAQREQAAKQAQELNLGYVQDDAATKRHMSALVDACGYFGTFPSALQGANLATVATALETALTALKS